MHAVYESLAGQILSGILVFVRGKVFVMLSGNVMIQPEEFDWFSGILPIWLFRSIVYAS